MKFALVFLLTTILAWTTQDYEIFDLNDRVQADIGASFYQWLQVPQKASAQEISKAYRRLSRQIHPDKFSGKARKEAEARFQRLSLVGSILRDHSMRQRYDFFLDKGFPRLRGAHYMYSRFRPGALATLAMLYLVASLLHYVALRITRTRDKTRLADLKRDIKRQAWGSLVPPTDGSDRRVGDQERSFLVRSSGEVYLEQDDHLVLLDEEEVNTRPGVKETILFRLPAALWNVSAGRFVGRINTKVEYGAKKEIEKKVKKERKKKGRGMVLPSGKKVYSRREK